LIVRDLVQQIDSVEYCDNKEIDERIESEGERPTVERGDDLLASGVGINGMLERR
jgi:hypothetical protein